MKEWTVTRNSSLKYQIRRRVSDNLGHPTEPYPSNWLRYGVTLIVPVSLVIYIDGSFIKHGIPVEYRTLTRCSLSETHRRFVLS
jgi:hypothetical protein